ncbi:10996_t:CDS:2 [Scutellospora calospora]|uniref:10996_t:CDS:1 n=1 Tax=Scutellospora calospora TaxID=85575 RepID=A0ACA9L7R7_9GLOM|nr:10996_t:CDS:2 [Scutellospora calospora]
MDIAAFFGVCVWMVPFAYFISLSANDNALPSFDPNIHNTDFAHVRNKGGILKNLLNFVLQKKDDLIPMASDISSSTLHARKSL